MIDSATTFGQSKDTASLPAPPELGEFQSDGCTPTWHERFRTFAEKTASAMGTPWAFGAAVLIIVLWGVSGPMFKYSDTWQLVINTGTTIVTFLMVFLIQNTQNRDSRAIHLKLSELIRATESRNRLVDVEDCTEAEINALEQEFRSFRAHHLAMAAHKKRASPPSASSTCASK